MDIVVKFSNNVKGFSLLLASFPTIILANEEKLYKTRWVFPNKIRHCFENKWAFVTIKSKRTDEYATQ